MGNINKEATEWLKKTGFLETDDLETIDYNNDVNLNDLETVDYNNDTQLNELANEIEQANLKTASAKQKPASKIIKKLFNYNKLNKKSKNDDIIFIKQVSIHSRDKFNKLATADEKVEFIKQEPVHSRARLK